MAQRTNMFLVGASLAAHWLFREIAPTLEPRVLRVALPLDSLPPKSEPLVEHHGDFPKPCWDEAFLDDLRELGRLVHSTQSAEVARARICTAISRCAGADQFMHFCSYPRTIEGYLACVLLQLSKSAYDAIPRLADFPHSYRGHTTPLSLLDAAIEGYLSECGSELENPATDPLRGWKPHTEALRFAGWAVTARIVAGTKGGSMVSELFPACTALASAQYEKRDSIGSMIVSPRQHPNVEPVVSLLESIPITELRTSRKLLQLSVAGLSLLFAGDEIYGVGKIAPGYDVQAKNLFTIKFTKPGTWEMWHHEQPLMIVSYGNPHLPTPGFPEAEMRHHLSRLFGSLGHEAQTNLCTLAKAACEQKHGTTFIISGGASQEAERLQHQCFRLSPLSLTPPLLPSLTDIDGAVLLDVHGTCHAIGVILDGRVSEQGNLVGNRGRGARYNAAVRYAADERCPRSLIIVRSEDGMLDFILGGETQPAAGEIGVSS